MDSQRSGHVWPFNSDANESEKTFREILEKLMRWLEWKRVADPEDLAQEALRRGLKRLREGQEITSEDPANYFFGIAQNLIRESWKAHKQEQLSSEEIPEMQSSFRALNRVEQRIFLKECFNQLSTDERDLMVAYINDDLSSWGKKKGLPPGTVRVRMHRARKRLEELAAAAAEKSKRSAKQIARFDHM